jgi:hypothetical protein
MSAAGHGATKMDLAHLDVGEMSLIRQVDVVGINVFLYSPLVARSNGTLDVIDSSLDRYPS